MGTSDEDVFGSLLAAAKLGQDWAWERLFSSLGPRILSYARSQSMRDPEDVLSDVLLDVVKGIDRFAGSESQFRSWVFTIAHSRIVDRRRRLSLRTEVELDNDQDLPAADFTPWSDLGDLGAMVEALPTGQRDVLLLRSVLGLSVDDVAVLLGQKPGAVRVSHHRALKALRRAYAVGV